MSGWLETEERGRTHGQGIFGVVVERRALWCKGQGAPQVQQGSGSDRQDSRGAERRRRRPLRGSERYRLPTADRRDAGPPLLHHRGAAAAGDPDRRAQVAAGVRHPEDHVQGGSKHPAAGDAGDSLCRRRLLSAVVPPCQKHEGPEGLRPALRHDDAGIRLPQGAEEGGEWSGGQLHLPRRPQYHGLGLLRVRQGRQR